MAQMQTDIALMQKASQDVEGVADQLTSQLTSLMGRLQPLESAWKGAGAESFTQVKKQFDEDMLKLNTALRQVAEAVGTAGKDYDVSDQEIQADIKAAGASAGSITSALKPL